MNHQFPPNIPQPTWWPQHHRGHPPSAEAVAANEEMFKAGAKEHMFEKLLTPSDVGKLNRLVIPKQHAEKYFPLGANSGLDSGLLLNFEDESGKCWSFRYSYWNSSQSYVLTKGWSRYVKEKGLDAGDVVVFGRLRTDGDRMFIGCRRRMAAAELAQQPPWSPVGPYPAHSAYPAPSTTPYQPDCLYAGAVVQNQTTPSCGKSKRLRLFGVNLEYQPKPSENNVSETLSCDGPSMLSQSEAHYQQYYTSNGHTSYPQNTMEYDWSGDANQMRYHQG